MQTKSSTSTLPRQAAALPASVVVITTIAALTIALVSFALGLMCGHSDTTNKIAPPLHEGSVQGRFGRM